jgi:hypothetical protein
MFGIRTPETEVPEDAPPVYHHLRVSETPPTPAATAPADESHGRPRSLFRRLGLMLR